MSSLAATRKGRPLVMLASLLAVWVGFRVVAWESPLPPGLHDFVVEQVARYPAKPRPPFPPGRTGEGFALMETPGPDATWVGSGQVLEPPMERELGKPLEPAVLEPAVAGGHQLLWMAAMAHLPFPAELAHQVHRLKPALPAQPAAVPVAGIAQGARNRWSGDGWLFLREGSDRPAAGPSTGSYGASQAGAILRYRFAPDSRRDAYAYLRATRALAGEGDSDVALGLAARPLPSLPLSAHVEARATRSGGRDRLRPSAFAVLQPAPVALPGRLRADIYAQVGYVGGGYATGFADGQMRVMRDVAQFDLAKVRLGAGAWGGAQEGAQRLDVGPSAAIDLRLGDVPARLSVDYRVRVAGDAAPGSGAALTLSTGF